MSIVDQFKKGWKTSEFWVGILLVVAPLVTVLTGVEIDTEGLTAFITSAVTGVTYIAGRTWLKTRRVDAVALNPENLK